MKPDPLEFSELLEAVADGRPLDESVGDRLLDDEERRLLRHLRLVASVADVHRRQAVEQGEGPSIDPRPNRATPAFWGHLELLECVGRGSFGEVWRARDVLLDAEVSLKLLHARPDHADVTARLLAEGRALARLRHPNVVTVHGVEVHEDEVGLRMEFVRGRTLEELLRQRGPFSAAEAGLIGQDVCRALAAIHRAGLVHRDVKAQNVMREDGGRIVVMDLGSGRLQSETADGGLAGTPLCLAPEVLAGDEATVASDIYSLGVLLYHLVTGSYPVVATSLEDLRRAHRAESARRLGDLRPDLPAPFVRTVERALEPRPQGRFPSAAAVGASLAETAPSRASRFTRRQPWMAPTFAIVTAIVAVGLWAVGGSRTTNLPWSAGTGRLAVLPFTIASADPELEYLASGIPMELTASLGQIGALRVVPWSFMKGIDPTETMEHVRDRTNADALVEGTIQRVRGPADVVRLRVQVYQAGTGVLLWTQTFERPIGALLKMQADAARQIAERLRVLISRREQMLLSRFKDVPTDAVELYLKGRQAWEEYRDDFVPAIQYLEKATETHPDFADAFAVLADCYSLQASYSGTTPVAEAYPRALQAANEALRLNPNLPEAFAARGFAKASLAWDWSGADQDLRQALDRDAQSASVRTTYSNYLTMVGRHDEAIAQSRIAEQRAPLSSVIGRRVGWALYMARKFDAAVVQLEAVLALEPNYGPARTLLARAYAELGDAGDAVRYIEPVDEGFEALSAQVYARVGRVDDARRLLAIATRPGAKGNPNYQVAAAYATLGDVDTAMEWLERAFALHESALVNIAFDPRLDQLRGSASFDALVARLGLTLKRAVQ